MPKITAEAAIKAIKTLQEFCTQIDQETCVNCGCPINDWCLKHCQYALPESWEVTE